MMDYVALGRQVKKQRHKLGLTQEKLAEKCGLSASYLGHIERGTRKASLETVVDMSNALDVTPDVLLIDSIKVSPPDAGLSISKRAYLREAAKQLADYIGSIDTDDNDSGDK